MILAVRKRSAVRLPHRLRRPVSPATRSFVRKRHHRTRQRQMERWKRGLRRMERIASDGFKVIRRWGLLVILLIFLGLFAFLVFSPVVQVREIRVQRTEARTDIEKIQKALAPLFGRHLLFLPKFEVQELLTAALPDLQEVQVSKSYPSELVVKVQLRPILARLTIENPGPLQPVSSGALAVPKHPLYDYLTDNGIYIASPLVLSGSTTFTIRDWTLRPIPGTQLITPEDLKFLEMCEAALQQQFSKHVTIRSVYLRAQEVHMQVGKISLWFDTRSSLAAQLDRLRVFVRDVGWDQAKTYVDLRLSGRVIYR